MTTQAQGAESRLARRASVPLMLLGGSIVAVQAQVNSRLAEELGDGLRAGALAAVLSFGSGLVLLSVVLLGSRRGRASVTRLVDAVRVRRLRWFDVSGGLAGAFIVASQGVTVGTIGIGLFIVAFTAGQAVSSLAADRLGLSPGGHHAVSIPRLIAAAFAVVAVALKASDQIDSRAGDLLVPFALVAVLAGVLQSVQQTVNGRASVVAGSWSTTWANFVVGTSGLLVLLAASLAASGQLVGLPREPWLYLGGVCGIAFIYIASWTVRIHGVLVLGLCTIAGQVVTAELIEVFVDRDRVGIVSLAGGGLTVLGAVIALWLRPRVRPPQQGAVSHM